MATRDDHGGSLPPTDIGKGDKNVDLAAAELTVLIAVLGSLDERVSAGVHADSTTGSPEAREDCIDEQLSVMVIMGSLATDEGLPLFYPGRMMDQLFKFSARFVDLLIGNAAGGLEVFAMDIALPIPRVHVGQVEGR